MKKLRLATLLALPIGLGLYLNSVASWRPRTLVIYAVPPNLYRWGPSVAFSPDGKRLASAGGGDILLWDVGRRQVVRTLRSLPGKSASRVAFSPDGKSIAASYRDKEDMKGQVRLWDAATGESKQTWRRDRSMTGVAFARDGKTLASSGYIGVTLWSTQSAKVTGYVGVGDTYWIRDVALSPDGHHVIGIGETDSILRWDVRQAWRKDYPGERPHIQGFCAAFSPDGRSLAIGTRGYVDLYDVQTSKLRGSFARHNGPTTAVAFSPDGSTLAHGDDDGRVELWDVASRKSLRDLRGHTKTITSLAFAPDGNTLASGSADGTVRLWRLR